MSINMNKMKEALIELLKVNDIKLGTKTARKYEYFFLHGAYTAAGLEMPPSIVMLMMAGRSILEARVLTSNPAAQMVTGAHLIERTH
jgi:hypothetical protein